MKTHLDIAKDIEKIILLKKSEDESVTFEKENGILYITFTAMSNKTFLKSYSLAKKIADITGIDDRRETWANPHFLHMWQLLEKKVMDEIDGSRNMPIVICGHGVAGAIALIAGYHLIMMNENLLSVVTFGAPAALNFNKTKHAFMHPLQSVATQFVFENDAMTKLFKLTKYCSADRTVIKTDVSTCEMDDYVESFLFFKEGYCVENIA